MPREFQPWRTYRDANGYLKYDAKELELHPVVKELAMNTAFVNRARAWSWSEQARKGGTTAVNTGANFAPWVDSNIEGVAVYFEAVMRKFRAHRPDLIPAEEMICSLGGQVALTLDLSASNPLLNFDVLQ